MFNATIDSLGNAVFQTPSRDLQVFPGTVTQVTPKAAESTYVELVTPRIRSMESIPNHSHTTKDQFYQALATASVVTAGLLFVAPFLAVAAGMVLIHFC
jgi:hypothetical protein